LVPWLHGSSPHPAVDTSSVASRCPARNRFRHGADTQAGSCQLGEFNAVDVKRVRTPSHVNGVVSTIKDDDSQAAVYRAESPSDAGLSGNLSFFGFTEIADLSQFCAFLAGPNLIAEGTVQSISTFSAASFHLRRTGTIEGLDGQDYHLTEVYQLNADAHDPNNPDTFKEIVSRISLKPEK